MENIKPTVLDKSILSDEEIQQFEDKATELGSKYGTKVHICVLFRFNDPEFGRIVAYIREPEYVNKLMYMDKVAMMGMRVVADEIREKYLIREESSIETFGDHQDFDRYKLGVSEKCIDIIQISLNQLKKN